ncbi:MAG TPA: TonB-dependent receptor [Bacteroidota bacterium]|nr:TonB-dependent receptor [Bacteroidota bacterium]
MFIEKMCYGKLFLGVMVALFFCFASHTMYAQGSGSIKGQVVDNETGEAIIGANIVIVNTSLGVAADVNGEFYLRYVPAGKVTLKVSSLGYAVATREIEVADGAAINNQIFRLAPQTITGEVVTVTAQARGQDLAINQQLASNTISNIVAADRIKELPDASAAESIGRLPGISIDRYNGEATGVAIRGLAPKYNTVTVNGVALPATNNQDRSVDLSLISSNLLDGIEVKKANTPDMDADALGGTIDLRLKEAPEGFQVNGGVQGGYNYLVNKLCNYSGNLSISNRFFDNKLGVIVGFNGDRNNRTADKLTAAYNSTTTTIYDNQLTLRREEAYKNRVGGNIILDYKIPNGKLSADGFYNEATTHGTYYQDQMDFQQNKHYYSLESDISTTAIYTTSLGIVQDFGWIKYDLGVAAVGTKTTDPNDYQWQFNQEAAAFNGTSPEIVTMPLDQVFSLETPNYNQTGIQQLYQYGKDLNEKTKSAQFNIQIPYRFTDNVNGDIKFGGKLRWIDRNFDQEQYGRSGLVYGGLWTSVAKELTTALEARYPDDFNEQSDSTLIANTGIWPLTRFNRGYAPPSNFLGGQYKLGMMPDLTLMQEIMNVFPSMQNRNWQRFSIGSLGSDYDGIERYEAGYIMTELNIGPYITFTPGVRYDEDYTRYHGETFQAVNSSNTEAPPVGLTMNTSYRSNNFWLPMIHLKIHPVEWLRIHLAATETVTRPDFSMYAPITSIDAYGNSLNGANSTLRDSRSKNLDAMVSVYQNYIGFITVSGFYKRIDDLIMFEAIQTVNRPLYLNLRDTLHLIDVNAPLTWFINPPYSGGSAPQINTYINNQSPAQVRGIEFEWQTNFWYLPSVLKGIVYSINWTYINSQLWLPMWLTTTKSIFDPTAHGFVSVSSATESFRSSRIPDQPSHILNSTLGYDYKGFSIRLSYIYQSDKFTSSGATALTDSYTAPYHRWDLSAQQKITDNIQLFVNFNNLTNTYDESDVENSSFYPQSLAYYGKTIDAGLRFNF